MQPVFQLSNTRIATTIAAILFEIALPLILALSAPPSRPSRSAGAEPDPAIPDE